MYLNFQLRITSV